MLFLNNIDNTNNININDNSNNNGTIIYLIKLYIHCKILLLLSKNAFS